MAIVPNTFAKATLTPQPNGAAPEIHFNPTSLSYTLENTVPQMAGTPKTAQYVAQTSGKLSMDLQFDTTVTGAEVRTATSAIAKFMKPSDTSGGSGSSDGTSKTPKQAPSPLKFVWGTFEFTGVLESFKETVDFFSAEGVGLRSLVSITLSGLDQVFSSNASSQPAQSSGTVVPTGASGSAAAAAQLGGDPTAARQLAAQNGLESLRFSGGAALQIGGGVQLNAAAGFSSGASASTSIGGVASASAGIGASASIGSSGGAVFGSSASAGVPATAGAFAGLATGRATVSTTTRLDPLAIVRSTIGTDVSTTAPAGFRLGGVAVTTAGAGLTANVGASLSFDE
jgi:hypothetical protein